ncbi:hypothetical protein THAOC_00030 [Thalassiosira oceanica]|uniref:GRF-type domain-containing protein n=1 Tax=Thalassiosira oceanica TaxID=159749 RepID=K0TRN2_THAOC|nr:hypothetical protein THAOC_00030 [Thalassiosira oceanica]|eukprot:EJK78092.1 hypothetical protein THAOC_00030 [Thalassiosira oceanica]
MVEGPGCTRNGKRIQQAVGCRVVDRGHIHPEQIIKIIINRRLLEAFSVGKECFLIWGPKLKPETDNDESQSTARDNDDVGLRLHFGMNGSLQARKVKNNVAPSSGPHWKKISLRLHFQSTSHDVVVEAYDTTVQFPVNTTRGRGQIITDALLDQSILPGVGNIIKVESLHRAGIDPRRSVVDLSDAELRRIIRCTRQYSMDWLKTGRAGTKQVYNRTECGTCRGLVKMCKLGGGDSMNGQLAYMARTTFWCTACQADEHTQPSTSKRQHVAARDDRPILCPQHGQRSMKLARVRKDNLNKLRIFYTCKHRSCQHFEWADKNFPTYVQVRAKDDSASLQDHKQRRSVVPLLPLWRWSLWRESKWVRLFRMGK